MGKIRFKNIFKSVLSTYAKPMSLFVVLFIFVLFLNSTRVVYAANKGYFNELNTGNIEIDPLRYTRLNNGNIALCENHFSGQNIIFDYKTDKFLKIEADKKLCEMVQLKDDRFIASYGYNYPPQKRFSEEIWSLISKNIEDQALQKLYSDKEFYKNKNYNKAKIDAIKAEKSKYATLPDDEKEEFYLPYLKSKPELYKQYIDYKEKYNDGNYLIIYDLENGETEKIRNPLNTIVSKDIIPLDNNRVFILGYSRNLMKMVIQIFNLNTKEFKQLDIKDEFLNKPYIGINKVTRLNDGKILILKSEHCLIFNPDAEELVEKPFIKLSPSDKNIIEIENGKLACFISSPADIIIYDINTGKFATIAHLSINRGLDYSITYLKNNKILISGGGELHTDGRYPTNKIEIFDINTNTITHTKSRVPKIASGGVILLDDSRVLMLDYKKCEMYIPNTKN